MPLTMFQQFTLIYVFLETRRQPAGWPRLVAASANAARPPEFAVDQDELHHQFGFKITGSRVMN